MLIRLFSGIYQVIEAIGVDCLGLSFVDLNMARLTLLARNVGGALFSYRFVPTDKKQKASR
jgi:hypothetical protein